MTRADDIMYEIIDRKFGEGNCYGCDFYKEYCDWVPYGDGSTPMYSYQCECVNANYCQFCDEIERELEEQEAEDE